MKTRREIVLDYSNNPELAEVFSRKQPGDKCRLTVTLQVNRVDEDGMAGTIEEISPDESYSGKSKGSKTDPDSFKNPGNGTTEQEVVHMDLMAQGDKTNGPDNAYLT